MALRVASAHHPIPNPYPGPAQPDSALSSDRALVLLALLASYLPPESNPFQKGHLIMANWVSQGPGEEEGIHTPLSSLGVSLRAEAH